MITEKIIKKYKLTCDACGTCYCDMGGPYFLDSNKMLQEAQNNGWEVTHYGMKCPDCKSKS